MSDGRRLRVTFEYKKPPEWGEGWNKTSREGDESGIIDQYNQLKEWERTGEEPIRNVVLEELFVTAQVISG